MRTMLLALGLLVLPGCFDCDGGGGGGGSKATWWDCECYVEYADDYYYYEETLEASVCDTSKGMNKDVNTAVNQCVDDLESAGFYDVYCECACEDSAESC